MNKLGYLRVGLVVPKLRVGDVSFNVKEIIKEVHIIKKEEASLIVFPEMCICGYTVQDLVYHDALLDACLDALQELSKITEGNKLILCVGLPMRIEGRIFNCAGFIANGKVIGIVPKTYLPNHGEYYEKRWFASGEGMSTLVKIGNSSVPFGTDLLFSATDFKGLKVGIEICEDLWAVEPPSGQYALAGASVMINISASNVLLGKKEYKRDLISQQSGRCLSGYVYVSSGPYESSTDTVFSGACYAAECGNILVESNELIFESKKIIVDIDINRILGDRSKNSSFSSSAPKRIFRDIEFVFEESSMPSRLMGRHLRKTPFVPSNKIRRDQNCKNIIEIQSAGLAKRLLFTGSHKVILGISGGLDSTLALLVACKTFDILKISRKGIRAVSMPAFGTSDRTKKNARELCCSLGVTFDEIDIRASLEQHLRDIELKPDDFGVAFENSQARERTQVLMDLANKDASLVIGTGDLSEAALGWCTFNGDHMSMYHVNIGVPKTLVRYLIEWTILRNFSDAIGKVLTDIMETPISPELLPLSDQGEINQETEKILGPFELHDFFLFYFLRFSFPPHKLFYLAKQAFIEDYSERKILDTLYEFQKRFFKNQFKRSSMPDGPKVGSVALSPRADWRMSSDTDWTVWREEVEGILVSKKDTK